MSDSIPYLGSKISLISKSEIRYEGILYTIDAQESIIALAKVQSFGTEDRPVEIPVPAKNEIYEYIIFRGTDIKKIEVCETPKQPLSGGLHNDPAIVGLQQHAVPQVQTTYPSASFNRQPLGPIGSMGGPYYGGYGQQLGQQNLSSTGGFSLGSTQPSELSSGIGSSSVAGSVCIDQHSVGSGQSIPAPIGAPSQSSISAQSRQQDVLSGSRSSTPTAARKSPVSDAGVQVSPPSPQQLEKKKPALRNTYQENRNRETVQHQPKRGQGYNQGGESRQSYNQGGEGRQGYNQGGESRQGYNQGGESRQGYNQGGESRQGYNQGGESRQGYNQGGESRQGYNQGGESRQGYNQGGEGRQGYNQGGEGRQYQSHSNQYQSGQYQGQRQNQGFYHNQQYQYQQYSGGRGSGASGTGGMGRGRPSRRTSQPRGRTPVFNQGNRPRQDQQIFDKEFDFEQANEEFEELRTQLAKTKISENGDQVEEKKEDSGHETATTGDESEDSASSTAFYDKTKSFFDSISCEAIERSKGKSQRPDWRQERKINVQTFGVATARRGYYPRNRGNYYGRGGYYRNYNQGFYRGGNGGSNYRGSTRGGSNSRVGGGSVNGATGIASSSSYASAVRSSVAAK